ncbi:hypothetical protein KEG38_05300 [Polyangium jinanense]|uniref:hypothetical protein n=1 Tax=Polyangium jinanense TaxID=2829994 RepID=UPI0023426282|nr:hypothetical protein [Polyangium jinanense]MDC3953246.1 hypothetical protein [Polyangium jinanense]
MMMKTNRARLGIVVGCALLALTGASDVTADEPVREDSMELRTEPVRPEVRVAISTSIAVAIRALRDAQAFANSAAVTGPGVSAISQSLAQAQSVLGSALAVSRSDSFSRGDAAAIAKSMEDAAYIDFGHAQVVANSSAITRGGPGLSRALARARNRIDDAVAVAVSVAGSGEIR